MDMARITVASEDNTSIVTLSEPDKDGDYSWSCNYGHTADAYRPIDETVANAEIHVDYQCH